MNQSELERLFGFERWANRSCVTALLAYQGELPEELPALGWHVLTAADNWISRIDGTEPDERLGWGSSPSIGDVASYLERVDEQTAGFVERASQEVLDGTFSYQVRDTEVTMAVTDALHQVLLHGAEHRAQAMYELGKLGGDPVELEYVWYLRDLRRSS